MRIEGPVQLQSSYLQFAGDFVPDIAPTGAARLYYDQSTATIRISANGGSFASPGAGTLRLQDLTEFTIPLSPTASATAAQLKLGAGSFTGGSANGQYLGIAHNAASFGGNWLVFRDNNAIRFAVAGSGAVTIGNAAGTNTIVSAGAAAQLNVEKLVVANTGTGEIAMTVNAPVGQTGDLEEWQVNASILARITKDGYLGIGGNPSTNKLQYNSAGLASPSTTVTHGFQTEVVNTVASSSYGIRSALYVARTAAGDVFGTGGSSSLFWRGTSATTQTNLSGLDAAIGIDGTSPTGTIADAASIIARSAVNAAGGSPNVTFTRKEGLLVENQGAGHSAGVLTITNSYGLRVVAQSGAGTQSFGIVSEGGESRFMSGAVGTIAVTLVAQAAQTANVFEARDSGGVARAALSSLTAVANTTLFLRAVTSQTGPLQAWRDAAGVDMSKTLVDGRQVIKTPNSAPTDADLVAASISAYLNEAGNLLLFRVKYADGTTLKLGSVALV